MIKKLLLRLRYLPFVAPLVFSLLFFGYLPIKYDIILYTDNIVGEGSCSTYLTSVDEPFAKKYQANAYFGAELKTLRIPNIRYNAKDAYLWVYGVESADITAIDVCAFGRVVSRFSEGGRTSPFSREVKGAISPGGAPIIHLDVEDAEAGSSISLRNLLFLPTWLWIAYFFLTFIIIAAVTLFFGYLADKARALRQPVLGASAVMAALLAGCFFCGSLPFVSYTHFLLNWLLLWAASLLVGALTLPWIGTVSVSLLTLIWYIADHFVISFRGKPIVPSDLKAFGTAMQVVDGYTFTVTWEMALGILVVAAYCAAVILLYCRMKKTRPKPTLKRALIGRGAVLAASAVIIVLCFRSSVFRSLNDSQWNAWVTEAFHREGIVLSYAKALADSRVKKPEGYSREAVDAYLAEYRGQAAEIPEGIQPVNIIMVMNEAFSDLRTVGIDERIDVMPYIDSLKDNTVQGLLYASVRGGGTCNTEYEALTGNSLAFFGANAYPYTESVTEPTFSLASYFSDLDYHAEAFHCHAAQNWNRNRVYPYLGFDVFHSEKDYPPLTEETELRGHPADQADYDYLESVNDSYRGEKRFLFDVTMQNHSDYDHFEDLEEAESVKEYGSELETRTRVYLSLIKASDDAVKQLVETYRDSDEPTMIIFFGDHQPGLISVSEVYTNVQTVMDFMKTKFFIWTNYESEAEENVSISANYMPWFILERANLPLPPYLQLLKEVHEKYPVISAWGVIDAAGNVYDSVTVLYDDPLIRKYQYVQYANVFDELDEGWFSVN